MKYCSKCGKEIMDEAVICVHCGCQVETIGAQNNAFLQPQTITNTKATQPESNTLLTCAIIFAFLMPIVGVILGIVGLVKYKSTQLRHASIGAIVVSIAVWIGVACLMGAINFILGL